MLGIKLDYASFIFHTVGIQIVILGWFPSVIMSSITLITCNQLHVMCSK